ncbi:transcription factor TFIIIC subunit TFC6 [Aspergillus puulaauensis]|uniref:Transcription factor TFIIIC complex subunit Tfc6 n=1 Tax=Aspergillus puulaauensis TaxID=1220207 RepID=A0A7R7XK03_9EURO|nr:uncharacterized protein APUU_30909A [Aspergillus puulaauensis]BCS22684.1 hypothetical protein APUU_30909A [Aspergillus puulaauensis]
MPSARRSGRLSGVRKTYTVDPLASEESDSNSTEETSKMPRNKGKKPVRGDEDDESDDEFQGNELEAEEDDGVDDAFDGEDALAENDEEEDEMDEPVFSQAAAGARAADTEEKKGRRPRGRQKQTKLDQTRTVKNRQSDGTIALTGDETHSRGTWNPLEHVGKSIHLQVTFGLDERDLLAILYTRERWARGADSTLPTRVSLDEAGTLQDYKYGSTFGVEPEDLQRERTRGWDWYYDDGTGARFRKRQRLEQISETEARQTYLPAPKPGKHTVLMGPTDNQLEFNMGQYDALNFGDAWGEVKSRNNGQTETDGARSKKKKRQGWILNIGQRIQCAAWAPNQSGLDQYLAVVAPISNEQKQNYLDPLKDSAGPAFRPSAPCPCALQLWAFKADKSGETTKSLDMSTKPSLQLILGAEWGDLRRIAWCSIPREPREDDDKGGLRSVGLLAGVWGDGYVRVIDVKVNSDSNQTEFYKVGAPVFEAKPLSTICTCVVWLSPSDIAVGCANGFVAIWSIASPSVQPQTEAMHADPLPYFYHPIHSTYVLNISSAYPTHAHLVATTSMDGETRLWSVADHEKDAVETTRMRVGSPHLTYSPWLQSFLSSDENDFVRMLTLRRFFATLAVARLPSTLSALATCSSWHPSVLFGSTGGSVIATNPLRRLLHSKEKQWQQTWFSHTWVRGNESSSPGTSRFYDGYRAESISLLRNMTGDRKMINSTMIVTIYEEETHITALSWNPNQSCAGWAAAGLGCGLLRVEDLAL